MKRFLIHSLALVSLLICVASTALWIRSHYVADRWYWPREAAMAKKTAPPAVQFGLGHVGFEVSPDRFAAGLALRGSSVINSAPGAVEFLIDSPPWPKLKPFYSQHDLPPGQFWGDAAAYAWLVHSKSIVVNASVLGFVQEDMRGACGSSILPKPGTVLPILVRRWTVPYWPITILSSIIPILWLRSQVRSRKLQAQGHCPICGYDLRATPARCPECGMIASGINEAKP